MSTVMKEGQSKNSSVNMDLVQEPLNGLRNFHISQSMGNNDTSTITKEDREAAEVLVQMGTGALGSGSNSVTSRRSVITDTRSPRSVISLNPNAKQNLPSITTSTSVPHEAADLRDLRPSKDTNSTSSFVQTLTLPKIRNPTNTSGFGHVYFPQNSNSTATTSTITSTTKLNPIPYPVISIQPVSTSNNSLQNNYIPRPMMAQTVPVSVLKRQDTIGNRSRSTFSSVAPVSSTSNSTSSTNTNRSKYKMPLPLLPQQEIDVAKLISGASMTPITPPIRSKQALFEKSLTSERPSLPKQKTSEPELRLNLAPQFEIKKPNPFGSVAKVQRDLHFLEPQLPEPETRKSGSSSKSVEQSITTISGTKALQNLNNFPPFPSHELNSPMAVPKWIGGNSGNSMNLNGTGGGGGVFRIINPNQIATSVSANNSVNGTGGGGILLPKFNQEIGAINSLNLIHLNTNGSGSKDFYLNLNPEEQRIRQSKLLKKAMRQTVHLNRDASQPIYVEGFRIPREFWAKAFVQADICHAAGILFKALFTTEEIQSCTLRGRNGTVELSPPKRNAIYRAVGWMKNKNQNPYSFDSNLSTSSMLSPEEKNMIEKKVFVERRYQTSRKIREVPHSKKNRGIKHINKQENITSPLSLPQFNQNQGQLVPPVDIVVKAEPTDFEDPGQDNENQPLDLNLVNIKSEVEDGMELGNDVRTVVLANSKDLSGNMEKVDREMNPPSPKQSKLVSC